MRRLACGLAREAFLFKLAEIVAPILLAVAAELEQILPAENPGRVHVVEHQPYRVIADREQFQNLHILLARYGAPLARRVALDLGARAAHAQIFRGHIEALAAVESDRKSPAILAQAQFRRPRVCHVWHVTP